MEFLKNSWVQAQSFLGQLSLSTRWLIGSALIILLMAGWLLMQYAAQPEMVPISRFAPDRQAQVTARLKGAGIPVYAEGGQMMVPAGRYGDVMVLLASGDLLAADTSAAFDDLIERQSPWQSNAQNAQALLLAKQKVLGQIIAKMAGVASASVMLSTPENVGFGATHVRPSASVNVVTRGSNRVDKSLVEAIAGLVSGAIAEMTPQDVVVIDANRGRQFTVKSRDADMPNETLELVQHLEQRYREKIAEVLSYIPNVILAVNVRIDPVHSKRIEQFDYEPSEPLKTEFSRETERRQTDDAGEPGARPNTGLDIAGSGGNSTIETTTESRNDFNDKNLTRRVHTMEVGHNTRQVSVTINVPRSYFVGVFKQGKPPETEAPDDSALQPVINAQLSQIQAQVEPLVSTEDGVGVVKAHMIPDRSQIVASAGLEAGGGQTGTMAMMIESSWIKPVALGALALMSLAIMFGMVRKATQQPDLPSIEDLAGVPPALPGEEDLIGEADESEAAMEGHELTDDSLHLVKLAEQISDMVKSDPAESAAMFRRWMGSDD